jgi:hypothetical protein
MSSPIHVLPVNDIQPHQENVTCNCGPKILNENFEMLIIHNAYDGRL